MDRLQNSNVVKIAVQLEGQLPQLIKFNQKQPLATIIQDLCNVWELPDPDLYALQFHENNRQNYVTEKNRNEIKNGHVLRLAHSPSKTAQDILLKLNSESNDEKIASLQKLSSLSTDMTFALEFINKQGLTLIINLIERQILQGSMLAFCLTSFAELMDHEIVSWEILEPAFISTIASYVNSSFRSQDPVVIYESLAILESIVLNSADKYNQVDQKITVSNLVARLASQNSFIQRNAISLINALFTKADMNKRKNIASTLSSKNVRNIILSNIIDAGDNEIGAEMAYQLYTLQTLCLGLLEQRINMKVDPQDPDIHEKIKELSRIAFDLNGSPNNDVMIRKLSTPANDYKKLGFKYDMNPALDFTEIPPGMLALDCMLYFAKHHVESYTKVVLENSCRADEHECPFGRTSIELVKLLCSVLRIGEPPSEQNKTYHPLYFTHDHPFEELYCVCIVLLNKTWKEMRATMEDFNKVFSVVREQIVRALSAQPKSFDALKQKLQTLTYVEITNLWQQERISREEWESHALPITQLKEIIKPEILDLIQKQRLNYLIEGTRFTKYSQRGQRVKDKFWYVRLSPNHKMLFYGDCDDKSIPIIEELPNKLPISDIKALVVGKDCPHMKDVRGRKTTYHLAFSLTLDSTEVTSLDFVAPDEIIFDYWTDGINCLLGNKMTSKELDNDLKTLLSMEIKLRLLDAEGINIPQDPPVVPPDPPNYDFTTDYK